MGGRVDTAPAVALLRRLVREAHDDALRWEAGSSYDEAITRRDEALVALAALEGRA